MTMTKTNYSDREGGGSWFCPISCCAAALTKARLLYTTEQ